MPAQVEFDPVDNGIVRLPAPKRPSFSHSPPRLLIVGAGNRGNAYAKAIGDSTNGITVAVIEPIALKRRQLGSKYIWGEAGPTDGQEFEDWRQFIRWEEERKRRAAGGEDVPEGIDGVFICVQDKMHKEVVIGLDPLGLHIMCEKPLATSLDDCIDIYKSLLPGPSLPPSRLFSIGHVLRYSPHNMLLRKLLLEDKVIGDVLSINHTEPVGWWHFAHSYVRGNWRKEATSAPSLLAKSCHDIDLLLWLLCSPPLGSSKPAHLPSLISSAGSLQYFKRTRKPTEAGSATNCLSCEHEPSCMFSAKKIYMGVDMNALEARAEQIHIVLPDIEECIEAGGLKAGEEAMLARLAEDYDCNTPASRVRERNWFGRCVYEADNDVCDNQTVTLAWDDAPIVANGETSLQALTGRGSKTATLHMVAFTEKVCERYSNIYGTHGEIYADSASIIVQNFKTGKKTTHYPHLAKGGHGGGDGGLARQFVLAIDRVKNHAQTVVDAQREYIGCSLEEIIRSHAVVFAAEEARTKKLTLDFPSWWHREVEARLVN